MLPKVLITHHNHTTTRCFASRVLTGFTTDKSKTCCDQVQIEEDAEEVASAANAKYPALWFGMHTELQRLNNRMRPRKMDTDQ